MNQTPISKRTNLFILCWHLSGQSDDGTHHLLCYRISPHQNKNKQKNPQSVENTFPQKLNVIVCPTVYYFAFSFLLADVHCNDSLVGYQTPGFCYSINIGTSVGHFLYSLLLPSLMEILYICVCRTLPFSTLEAHIHRWGRCWGGPTQSPGSSWKLSWSACQVSHFAQARAKWVCASQERPAVLSMVAINGQGHLSTGLRQHPRLETSMWPLVVTEAMDINSAPSFNRAMKQTSGKKMGTFFPQKILVKRVQIKDVASIDWNSLWSSSVK